MAEKANINVPKTPRPLNREGLWAEQAEALTGGKADITLGEGEKGAAVDQGGGVTTYAVPDHSTEVNDVLAGIAEYDADPGTVTGWANDSGDKVFSSRAESRRDQRRRKELYQRDPIAWSNEVVAEIVGGWLPTAETVKHVGMDILKAIPEGFTEAFANVGETFNPQMQAGFQGAAQLEMMGAVTGNPLFTQFATYSANRCSRTQTFRW